MKLERILSKNMELYGVEVLNTYVYKNREEFFRKLSPSHDFSLFRRHLEVLKVMGNGEVFFFLNLKPSTLIAHLKELESLLKENLRVVIELTEEPLSKEQERLLLEARKTLPCLICLDDFGSGASNYDRLNLLLPDFVKVDMQVVKRHAFEHVVSGLKKALGNVKVIAEKVETYQDYMVSRSAGVDLFQGYFFEKEELHEGQSSQT